MTQWWTDPDSTASKDGSEVSGGSQRPVGIAACTRVDPSDTEGWQSAAPTTAATAVGVHRSAWPTWLATVGVGLLVGYVALVVTQPIVVWRRSLFANGSEITLTDLDGGNARLWVFASLVAAAACALVGFGAVQWRWLAMPAVAAGIVALVLLGGAVAGPEDWLGRNSGDFITRPLHLAIGLLALGVAVLLGSVGAASGVSFNGVVGWFGVVAALGLGAYLMVSARTEQRADQLIDDLERSSIDRCDGRPADRLWSSVGQLIIVTTPAISDRTTAANPPGGSVAANDRVIVEEVAALWADIEREQATIDGQPVGVVLAGSSCGQPGSMVDDAFVELPIALPEIGDDNNSPFARSIIVVRDGFVIAHNRYDPSVDPSTGSSNFLSELASALRIVGYQP